MAEFLPLQFCYYFPDMSAVTVHPLACGWTGLTDGLPMLVGGSVLMRLPAPFDSNVDILEQPACVLKRCVSRPADR